MKKFIVAAIACLGYATAISTENNSSIKQLAQKDWGHHDRVKYDRSCEYWKDKKCLKNDIHLYGPKVVLVNLDDRCQVEKYEREGIFIQEGDMVFVTGRENAAAYQEWEFNECNFDYDILFPSLDYDIPVISDPGHTQELIVLEAVGTGKTTFDMGLYWGGEEIRNVSLDVYVNMQPALASVTPRDKCKKCY